MIQQANKEHVYLLPDGSQGQNSEMSHNKPEALQAIVSSSVKLEARDCHLQNSFHDKKKIDCSLKIKAQAMIK